MSESFALKQEEKKPEAQKKKFLYLLDEDQVEVKRLTRDDLDEHPAQIANMNPTDELPAAASAPAEKTFGESGQNWQRTAIAPQHKSDSQQNAARIGHGRQIEGGFPRPANSGQRVFSRRGIFVA